MKISSGSWRRADVAAFLVAEGGLDAALRGAPAALARAAREAARRFQFDGKEGSEAVGVGGGARVVLVGVGRAGAREVQEGAARAVDAARRERARTVAIGLAAVAGRAGDAALGARLGAYRYDRWKKDDDRAPTPDVVLVGTAGGAALRRAGVIADAVAWARDLVNDPPEAKPPARIAAAVAARLGRLRGLQVTRYDARALEKMRCRAILAVGRGSTNPPVAVRAEWRPRGARRHLVLVGKGMTFDSGGLNIKPYEGMKEMKMDMGGAAAVLAALEAIARLGLPLRVTVLAAFAENMPGPAAYKPGDVVRGRSGKTIEVLNTDAEGRILLSDLLTLAVEERPDLVVDAATLTGAIIRALGATRTGLFAARDEDAAMLERAADRAGERVWRMPLGPDYREMIKSDVAEIKNVGGAGAGASTAAHFLAEFVGKTPWAHLDIAGTAWAERAHALGPVGATGAGVRTLVTLAEDMASA